MPNVSSTAKFGISVPCNLDMSSARSGDRSAGFFQ